MELKYDFSGWATRNDLVCADGRTIRRDAFKHCDGMSVPIVWNHQHNDPANILGHAILENRQDGVYAYGFFNDTDSGKAAKQLVQHGDVQALSIYANGLKQQSNGRGKDVIHGDIRELSLVVAGANPGAFIDFVDLAHGEGAEQEVIIGTGEPIALCHSEEGGQEPASAPPKADPKPDGKNDETIEDVWNSLTDKQKLAMGVMLKQAAEGGGQSGDPDPDPKPDGADGTVTHSDNPEGGDNIMKHNVFDKPDETQDFTLSHSAQTEIIASAKTKSVGTLQGALKLYAEQNSDTLKHGIDDIEALFPEYKDLKPGAPELITRDQGWVGVVMSKVHKSPISRIRTRNMDARGDDIRAHGYQKGKRKTPSGNMKLMKRTTDPQTIYIRDSMHRDDIIDITDFDVVNYKYGVMKMTLNEEIAIAIMIGDGRDEADEQKISEEHIRSIWNDDDLYTIHYDVDIEAARNELQGSRTDMNFGDNYIYAEAIITAALYSREKFKGTGTPDLFCTPHLVNVMLLARDLNGRRIYNSKADLAAALNVGNIYTAEQFEGLARTDKDNVQHKLLGLFVNLADYTVGSTKGGEITRFNQFDIDFNQEKYLIETRLSGALHRLWSAIALEEPVKPASGGGSNP
ncbi:HK97 family phage prohead protease [Faecalibaculum rodentium]|uniref:HK97 family phage prohead protease n=1 Tax=Faecalibaculum rodentium TaxID=1702221 RepID=UPI0025A28AE0|nr:HK97 family phage prohead protease [Faecalibaculum rodentium]